MPSRTVNYTDFDAPSFTASDAQALEDYLNNTVYHQANIPWSVSLLPDLEIDYDLNHDGKLDYPDRAEANIIRENGNDSSSNFILFIVDGIDTDALGFAKQPGRMAFVGFWNSGIGARENAAHELGHSQGLPHPFEYPDGDFNFAVDRDPENLMDYGPGTKLRFNQWIYLNRLTSTE